jgi:hypothetical protein
MTSEPQKYADRVYRSGGAIAGGVLLLGLTAWLGGDALLRGEGRTPLFALAGMALAVPLIVAFSVRPAVFASDTGMRVRNPFRTVLAPWSTVETIRAGYSCEMIAGGVKYQLWSIPVSLRARSKASRHNQRLASGEPPPKGAFGIGTANPEDSEEKAAPADAAVRELRELREQHRQEPQAKGEVTVGWALEIIAPAILGALALIVLWTV